MTAIKIPRGQDFLKTENSTDGFFEFARIAALARRQYRGEKEPAETPAVL